MSLNSPELGPVTVVGNTSGGTQYAYKPWKEGKVIRKLTVWEQSNRMRGIKLWKSGEADNGGQVYGSASGTASTFEFQPGELITSLSLWQGMWDHLGDRAGRIEFTTGYQGGSGTAVNVYSGVLVGVQVRAGDDINSWGFGFLSPASSGTSPTPISPASAPYNWRRWMHWKHLWPASGPSLVQNPKRCPAPGRRRRALPLPRGSPSAPGSLGYSRWRRSLNGKLARATLWSSRLRKSTLSPGP